MRSGRPSFWRFSRPKIWLSLRDLLLVGPTLQPAEFLRFRFRGLRIPQLSIKSGEAEVCLRSQRAFLFDLNHSLPGFLRNRGLPGERSGFAERVEGFRHVWM